MDSETRRKRLNRTHALGIATNAGLAALKLSVGSVAGSRALVADGVHSISDVVMNASAWLGWRWSARPRDRDHHYGHGNGEALTTLAVGVIVIVTGAGLIWTSLRGESRVGADALGAMAVGAEAVTMVVKALLARFTRRRGQDLNSSILVAVSRDNRADVLTSGLIMLAIIGAIFGLRWLEPVAAVGVGLLIIWDGLRSGRDGLNVLMDRAPDHALTARITQLAAAVAGVESVDDVRVHPLGTHLRVDMEIAVDGSISVAAGHDIAHAVEDAIVEGCGDVEEVAVHINPASARSKGAGEHKQSGRPEGRPRE